MLTHKICRRCLVSKPVDEMKKDKRNGDNYSSFCKDCHKLASIAWQRSNTAKVNATRKIRYEIKKDQINAARKARYSYENIRWQRLEKLYGVSKDWYENQMQKQNGKCAICGSEPKKGGRMFAVDHDHSCCEKTPTCGNCNRGLLCHHCNVSLHKIEINRTWLQSVVVYLDLKEGYLK